VDEVNPQEKLIGIEDRSRDGELEKLIILFDCIAWWPNLDLKAPDGHKRRTRVLSFSLAE